jgi:glutamyl-tRNA synthetase
MRNYLARLGWSHGDDEFFTDAQALEWFDLDGIGRAPARLDLKKLDHLSGLHIAAADDAALLHDWRIGAPPQAPPPSMSAASGLLKAMPCSRSAPRHFRNLLKRRNFVLASRPIEPDEKGGEGAGCGIPRYTEGIDAAPANASWNRHELEAAVASWPKPTGWVLASSRSRCGRRWRGEPYRPASST